MRAFLLSALALIILCILVIWNGIYISKTTDKMRTEASKIVSLENESDFLALRELWDKHKAIISISVPHTESDEMEKAIVTLQTKFENNISFGFSEAVALTIKAIDEIKVHGTASLDNVL